MSKKPSAASVPSRKALTKALKIQVGGDVNCSLVEGCHLTHQALAHFHSSQLYLLAKPTQSSRFRLPVHDFIAHSPGDPLRKINNLAAVQFTTLFHGYTSLIDD